MGLDQKLRELAWRLLGKVRTGFSQIGKIVRLGKGFPAPCNSLPTITAPGSTRKKDVASTGGGADAEAAGLSASKPCPGFWSRL